MANVAHSTLTGADLHESKGVAAATANKVYVTDGAGSGSFLATSTFNTFGNQLFHLQDSVASATGGQSFSASTWNTRRLQTSVTNEISSASVSSSQLSLPLGTYFIEATTINFVNIPNATATQYNTKLRLRNITAGSTLLVGVSWSPACEIIGSGGNTTYLAMMSGYLSLTGRFTLAGTTTLELQNWSNSSQVTGGQATGSGENEVYSNVLIWKTA